MTPERWQQIKNVFTSALEYEPAQRPSFLNLACNNDAALREEVESLLAAHEKDGSFIDSPAFQELSPALKPANYSTPTKLRLSSARGEWARFISHTTGA